ncbi:DUF551 domain-containing protein [Burkholderia multivorans]|uniref:DUF551 domain-containing protein n=1 Tax=Burkholderia multivorans TaxID=87883 RepID=UPI0020B43BF6|nr:DUF551 domain-containing protein [Burkholderia multivorans]
MDERDEILTKLTEFDVLIDAYMDAQFGGTHQERCDARISLRLLYREALTELQAARRTTPDREAWISVAERLPESPGDYLLFRPAAHLPPASDPNITIREFFGRGKVGGDRFGGAHAVTHWMPLPAAPTSDQGEKS